MSNDGSGFIVYLKDKDSRLKDTSRRWDSIYVHSRQCKFATENIAAGVDVYFQVTLSLAINKNITMNVCTLTTIPFNRGCQISQDAQGKPQAINVSKAMTEDPPSPKKIGVFWAREGKAGDFPCERCGSIGPFSRHQYKKKGEKRMCHLCLQSKR